MKRKTVNKFDLTSDDVRCALIEYVTANYQNFNLGNDARVDVVSKGEDVDIYEVTATVVFEGGDQ